MTHDEVIEYWACRAEQLGSEAPLALSIKLSNALEPVLSEFSEGVQQSLIRDALGIVFWLHTDAYQILLDDAPALKGAEGTISNILGPLNDLVISLEHASPMARNAINDATDHSTLRKMLSRLQVVQDDERPGHWKIPVTNRHRISLGWNFTIFICILGVRVIRRARQGLLEQLSVQVDKPEVGRLKQIRAFEDLSRILDALLRLSLAVGDRDPLNRLRFSLALMGARIERILMTIAASESRRGKRDYVDMACLVLRASTLWCHRLRFGIAFKLGRFLRVDPKVANQKRTLDHIREAIFYLTHAWTSRTGEAAGRKNLNDVTRARVETKGSITAESVNSPYERFINAALDTMRPLNKHPVTDSVKPYDAQIVEILNQSYQPHPAGMDFAIIRFDPSIH